MQTQDEWTLERIQAQLGSDHVAWVKRQENPVALCESRATGYWYANSLDDFRAYKALARLLS